MLDRRTFLRGMAAGGAVSVGLPILEAMLDSNGEALANGRPRPVRFISWYYPAGVVLSRWVPATTGAYTLSESLAPLTNVHPYVSALTGFDNRTQVLITHHEGTSMFVPYDIVDVGMGPGFYSNPGGPSIDQTIADVIAAGTPVRSIHTQISKRDNPTDNGNTSISISHQGSPGSLITNAPQTNPQDVFNTLFTGFVNPNLRARRASVVDAVRDQAQRLRTRLGTADQQRLDQHISGLADLETAILALPASCTVPSLPTEDNTDTAGIEPMTEVNAVMAQLVAYAFACDITRVASNMVMRFVSGTILSAIGHTQTYESLSISTDPTEQEAYHDGIVYIMGLLATWLETLQATPDGFDGENLLDNTVVFASTDVSNGATHAVTDMPVLVAGRGGGALVHPGIHHASLTGTNAANILLTLLQVFDPMATSIGGDMFLTNTPEASIKAP